MRIRRIVSRVIELGYPRVADCAPAVNSGEEFVGGETTGDCNIFNVQWVVVGKLLCYALSCLSSASIALNWEGLGSLPC